MCPAAANRKREVKTFLDIFAKPIAARLNSVAPGANLDPQDVYAIMHLCPFETIAKEALSPFCSMFSREDFQVYEYAWDVEKFYYTGYASHPSAPEIFLTFAGMEVHWEPFKASVTSTNSSDASRTRPHIMAYKPTRPYSHPPKPSR